MLLALALAAGVQADPFHVGEYAYLMRQPTMSANSIVFQFAGDLWKVAPQGGQAERLTTAVGIESRPRFSPDGTLVAFSGEYDGNVDVFVMPAAGGVPKRLTAHPSADIVLGWSPDGKSVLFTSSMLSNTDARRLFTVAATGGVPRQLPFPNGVDASFSPDGSKIAYVPIPRSQQAWKRYRGGQVTPVWIGNLADSKVKRLPWKGTNDSNPMWIGDSIYYLSDPAGPVGMFRYDTATGDSAEVLAGSGFDIKSASAFGDKIVYEKLGSLNLYDTKTRANVRLPVEIKGDFLEVRQQIKDVSSARTSTSLSPSGARLVASARGYIFTVPVAKGDIRLLSGEQGQNRKGPIWSPDGKTIAYTTDTATGSQLALYDTATGAEKSLPLGISLGLYDLTSWSPDSHKIAYLDEKLNLWLIDVTTGVNTKVDTATYRQGTDMSPSWSPDSQWLAYTKDLGTHFNAVFLYSLASRKATQITDGLADASSPSFDRDGKHLYFAASTNKGIAADIQDTSSLNNLNVVSSVYAVVLRRDLPNPLQPETDEEKPKSESKPEEKKEVFGIDLDRINRRIVVLPIPVRPLGDLKAGPAGTVFVLSQTPVATITDSRTGTLQKFSFADRKTTTIASDVNGFDVSADGSKLLLSQGSRVLVVPSSGPVAPDAADVSFTGMQVKIDPRAEWTAMFHQVWRNERLRFYDANMHGANTLLLEHRYEPFLKNIYSRDDLNYLFTDMLGELTVGHMFIGGGDIPGVKGVPGGLLGADYTFENGKYKIARIYDGEQWNPSLRAPLAQPGVNAQVGEFVLAIDGKEINDATDIYELLEGRAGKQVKVRLGPTADGVGSREVIVVPVGSEFGLRQRAWAEDNRRYVEEKTGGRCGYVHVPDTNVGGWVEFTRYYFAQAGKDAIIVDDRFNHGGLINDFMVREMTKPLDFGSLTRYGNSWVIPPVAIYGPKVMLINEAAGSGGDIFPYLFRKHGVGKLIGKRTWGGMISNYGFNTIDGGRISSPDDALFDPITGKWVIENEGVAPDVEVELDPALWRQGKDSQLERAIDEINTQLRNYKLDVKKPAYPVKTKVGG